MSADPSVGLDEAIAEALEEVLGDPQESEAELHARLRTLIGNCVADNYDESDVRAVIQLAIPKNPADEEDEDD